MIRMELDISTIVRVILLSAGYIIALKRVYKLPSDYRFIVSLSIVVFMMYAMTVSTFFIIIKLNVYLLVAVAILTIIYKKRIPSAIMFSFVLLVVVCYSDFISLQIMARSNTIITAIETQSNNFAGFMAVFTPSFTVFIFYVLGGEALRGTLVVNRKRLEKIYIVVSISNILVIQVLSVAIVYAMDHMTVGLSLVEVFNLLSFAYISTIFLPIGVIVVLHSFYKFDLEYERLETDALKVNDLRITAHRYSHNLTNIIIAINHLSKEGDTKAIKEYLEKV